MEISIYHAHEFDKTIKKHGNDLYTACPSKTLGDTAPSKCEVSICILSVLNLELINKIIEHTGLFGELL